jgi:mono/diheme cytochrome c family protein
MKLNPRKLITALTLSGLAALLLLAATGHDTSARIERGRFLVGIAGCADCHTPRTMGPNGPEPDQTRWLSGHPEEVQLPPSPALPPGPWSAIAAGLTAWAGPWGTSYAANLTPDENTGLGIWTEAMFIQAMRSGKHMGSGRDMLPPMPWQNLAGLTDDDLKAVYAYLRSLPAITNHVPEPLGPDARPLYE